VERVYEILKAEIETTMRLLAVERIEDLGPQHVSFFSPFLSRTEFLCSA
jgi:isopentenyl diphosphate isomerase/L-lactate dehydrogenase-like FMN-dependent dehydrogenase